MQARRGEEKVFPQTSAESANQGFNPIHSVRRMMNRAVSAAEFFF
jgi:hypothetical protein